jgi:hypothetical protein
MLLGFAITEHCNLRCPHCIRDDVTTVRNLDPGLILRTVDQGRELFGEVAVSMTGGEPTIHPKWERIIAGLHERGVSYRFVTNGWHMRRLMPGLDRHPPASVRCRSRAATRRCTTRSAGAAPSAACCWRWRCSPAGGSPPRWGSWWTGATCTRCGRRPTWPRRWGA